MTEMFPITGKSLVVSHLSFAMLGFIDNQDKYECLVKGCGFLVPRSTTLFEYHGNMFCWTALNLLLVQEGVNDLEAPLDSAPVLVTHTVSVG